MIIRTVPRRRLPPHIRWLDYRVLDPHVVVPGDIIALPFRGGHTAGVVLETNVTPEISEDRITTIAEVRTAGAIDPHTLQAFVQSALQFHVPLPAFLLAFMPEPPKRAFQQTADRALRPSTPARGAHILVRHRGGQDGLDHIARFIKEQAADGTTIVLVPDVTRGETVAATLTAAGLRVAFFHHQLNDGDAWRTWTSLHAGLATVLVTTRSGVCAPAPNLHAVVVDSEDDDDFVQRDAFPYVDSRVVAENRATQAGASLLLASETPRFVSAYRAHTQQWTTVVPEPTPVPVTTVHLRQEPQPLASMRLSGTLIDATHSALQSGFSVLCFLNRAVESRSVRCAECRKALACSTCTAVLAVRNKTLWCFRCQQESSWPDVCPHCHSPRLNERVPGIPRVATALAEQIGQPVHALVASDDLKPLPDGPVVILATETIWKNAAPLVAGKVFRVVAALEADMGLTQPHAQAAEEVWATLMRLRNWAERDSGQLILQVWNDEHPVFVSIRSGQPAAFLKTELTERAHFGYPPFGSRWRIFVPIAENARAEQMFTRLFPASDWYPEDATPTRRAVLQHRPFSLKLPATRSPDFSSLPPTWIIEPDPMR